MTERTLKILDEKLASGQTRLTTGEIRDQLGLSSQAASNLLARWRATGLVDRVARGHYVIRQLGVLGTRAASEDVALAVGAFFAGEPHRIAYRSALDHHGMLLHPARTIQIASPRQVALRQLSGRPVRTVLESQRTILVGGEDAGHGARVSSVERSLLDAAARLDLIGGVAILAEALGSRSVEPGHLEQLAHQLEAGPALRRLGTLADHLAIPGLAARLSPIALPASDIQLDPEEEAGDAPFRDRRWRVVWPAEPDQIAEALRQ